MAGKDARVTFIEMARFSFSMGMSQPTLDPFTPGEAEGAVGVVHPGVASAVFSIFILSLGAAKNRPITVTDVQSDGRPFALPRDSYRAPHVCAAALRWLPREIRDDRPLLQQWIDNNMSYLDARALVVLQAGGSDFRRDSWSVYHNLHMCRLGVSPLSPLTNPLLPPPPLTPARVAATS
eukprot:scaffold16943_cov121-Isochrysis_galbana.AAC.1